MNLNVIENAIRWVGGVFAYAALGIVLFGVWRGTQRRVGRSTGTAGKLLRNWWFYLASTIFFFGIAWLGWVPLKWTFPPQARIWVLIFGSLSYFFGMAFVLWGRLALGKNYFVSTGFGAQLFADHQLITTGPYAIVRHPMYAGLMLASIGALLLYNTWTTLFFVFFSPLTMLRVRQEETALSAEFGEEWKEYCRRVPAFIPRLRK
ncbi:MAG: hypothetical protein DPW18_15375 [Chloroflexi bacterium]|nr:hypothetical protein [Chloroflexota bacterium]MDL1911391.1 isoprenylcysteine carboxylmethyltransferase family protein [Chloroflexi bacterium CFX6]